MGFDDHGQAHFQGNRPGFVHGLGRAAHGHGHTGSVQEALGQVFVLCNRFGNRAGGVGFSGLDVPLLGPPTKLHQAAVGQAANGNATGHGRVHDGPGGGSQAHIFIEFVQLRDGAFQVKTKALNGRLAQLIGQLQGQSAHGLFGVLNDHLKHPGLFGGGGAAERHGAARMRLQPQGDFFQGVCQGHGFTGTLTVKGAHFGKDAPQLLFDGVLGRQAVHVGRAADDGFNGGVAAPQVGATQSTNTGDLHELFFLGFVRGFRPKQGCRSS